MAIVELGHILHLSGSAGIFSEDPEAAVCSRLEAALGSPRDREIDRLRVIVEEIEGPDIERATS